MPLALLGWNLAGLFMQNHAHTVAKIPYSVFVSEVQSNNVSRVGIEGSQIIGELQKPRQWSRETGLFFDRQHDGGTTAPVATPAKTKAADETTQVDTFTTVFPRSIGDPELLPLLEKHGMALGVTEQQPACRGTLQSVADVSHRPPAGHARRTHRRGTHLQRRHYRRGE